MKIAFVVIVVVFAVLACGCTAAAPSGTGASPSVTPTETTAASIAVPDITGTWTGSMQGYDEGTGYSTYPNMSIAMVVTEQHDRIFTGYVLFRWNGGESKTDLAGVIGRDGRTFSMIEKDNGYTFGEILSKDEIELIYLNDGTPSYSVAVDTLKRA
jgi:ABC-type transport system substrate-binding protein